MWAVVLWAGCDPAPVVIDEPTAGCDPEDDLAAVRAATARYADVELARADGYQALPCEADETGAAMGWHYTRVQASLDQRIELLAPEILLYMPEGDGLVLAGVEYVLPALLDGEITFDPSTRQQGEWAAPPELFCQVFDGPMEGHTPLQPWHYDLHVWVHDENPRGPFAQYHPGWRCSETY